MYEALHQVPRPIIEMSGIHRHLLTVSSDHILEIHIIYDAFGSLFDREYLWSEIDNLILQQFTFLYTLSIEFEKTRKAPWAAFSTRSVQNLPQVYQKGILHAVLPEPRCLLQQFHYREITGGGDI